MAVAVHCSGIQYIETSCTQELRNSIGMTSHPVAPLLPDKVLRSMANQQVGGLKCAGG